MSEFDLDTYFAKRDGAMFGSPKEESLSAASSAKQESLQSAAQTKAYELGRIPTEGNWDHIAQSPGFKDAPWQERQQVRGDYMARTIGQLPRAEQIAPQEEFMNRTQDDVFRSNDTAQGTAFDSWVTGGGVDSDLVRRFYKGGVGSVGSVFGGIGDAVEQGSQAVDKGLSAIGLGDAVDSAESAMEGAFDGESLPKAFQALEDWMHQGVDAIDSQISEESQEAYRESTPSGDWSKPETWTFGSNPSLGGYAQHLAEIAGQLVPQIAAAGRGGDVGGALLRGAAIGGLQAGGSQAKEAEDRIRGMDAKQLLRSSGFYRDQVQEGVSHEEAQETTAKAAGGAAFLGGAPIGSLGGALTGYVLGPLQRTLKGGAFSRVGKSVAIDAVPEGIQEVTETTTARMATNEAIDGNQSLTDTVGEFALGAMGGGLTGLAGVAGNAEMTSREPKRDTSDTGVRREAVAAAEESGDITALSDPTSPTYAPEKATEVLNRLADKEGTTPEQRTAYATQADQVVSTLEAEVGTLREAYEKSAGLTEDQTARRIKAREEKLATLAPDATERTQVEEELSVLREVAQDLDSDDKAMKQRRRDSRVALERGERQLKAATETQSALRTKAAEPVDIDNDITLADSAPETEGAADAVRRIISLSIETPSSITSERATALADNTGNALNDTQRSYLRAFSASQQAANEIKGTEGVSTDVFEGGKGYIGIDQYRQRFATQMRSDNQVRARAQVTGIKAFADQREHKLSTIEAGLNEIQASEGKTKRVDFEFDSEQGQFVRKDGFFKTQKARAENGGLTITERGSAQLMDNVAMEAQAVRAAATELETAYAAFTDTPTRTPAPVTEAAETSPTVQEDTATPDVIATSQQDTNEVTPSQVTLTTTGRFTAKDQKKADQATKFIGRGSVNSSTNQYAQDWGEQANTGTYTAEDTVFVSAEGNRKGRVPVDAQELGKATAAGATIITDNAQDRDRAYNTGEREVASFLSEQGYTEASPGTWTPADGPTVSQPTSNESQQPQTTASVPTMITQAMRKQLSDLSYTPEQVRTLTPQQAWDAIEAGNAQPEVADATEETASEPTTADTTVEAESEPTTELTESAPAIDEPVDSTTTEEAAPVTDTETEATVDEETGLEVDPETGEVIEESPTQNNDPETTGEGQLSLLEEAGDRRQGHVPPADFKTANLIREYLRQDMRDLARRVTKHPLVEMKNFLTQLRADKSLAQRFVTGELTEEQEGLVNDLSTRLNVFNEAVKGTLPKWTENSLNFRFQDYIGYFRDDVTGLIDENVATAISAAMYGWLADNASLKYHNESGINRLLARDSKAKVNGKEKAKFTPGWHRENYMANDIGRRASEALGFTADRGVPQDVLEKVQGALGGRAVTAMLKQGLLEKMTLSEFDLAKLSDREAGPKAEHKFLRVPVDDSAFGRMVADDIIETSKGTQSLLPKLFGVEDRQAPPSFKPVPFKATNPKRSLMQIAKGQKDILNEYNKTAYYVQEDSWSVWSALSENTQALIAGGVDMTKPVHVANYDGARGKNDALVREAQSFAEFMRTVEAQPNKRDTPFYFNWVVWKMGRMGITGSMVNPQTSKIHRELTKQAAWEHTVQIDNEDGSFDKFLLAVGDALGVKTDNDLNVVSVESARDKMGEPVIEAGVVAILKSLNSEALTDADQAAIVAATQAGGEAMHSYSGLVAIARYLRASENSEPSFTHTLKREIDGKTNGPMFAQWLLGAASTAQELLNVVVRGGFFTPTDGVQHIGDWARNKQNLDMYQLVAKKLNQVRAASLLDKPRNVHMYAAVDYFMGESQSLEGAVTSAGRKMVKQPVTALNFGSGMNTVIRSMGIEFVEAVHAKIEKVAAISDRTERETARKELIGQMNGLLSEPFNANMTMEQLLKHEIKGPALDGVLDRYRNSVGQDIKATLEDVFAPLIERRTAVNTASTLAFTLYDAAYRHERQQYLRELMGSDTIATEKQKGRITKAESKAGKVAKVNTTLLQDLTQEQEAEVRARVEHLRPLINTAFSKQEGDLEAGLMLARQQSMTDGTYTYRNMTKLPPDYGVLNLRTQGSRSMQVDPGLGTVIWQVHSGDAFVAANSLIGNNALNVHDALIVGLNDVEATARSLNKQTFEMLLGYSPAMEVADSYTRTLQAFVEYAKDSDVMANPQVRKMIQESLDKMAGKGNTGSPEQFVDGLRNSIKHAWKAEQVKLEGLLALESISQYTMEDGHYTLTPDDKARINEALEAHKARKLPDNLAEDVKSLVKQLKGETSPTTDAVVEENTATDTAEVPSEVDSTADNRLDSSNESFDVVPSSPATLETAQEMLAEIEDAQYNDSALSIKGLIRIAKKGATPATAAILDTLSTQDAVLATKVWVTGFGMGSFGRLMSETTTHSDGTGTSAQTVEINFNALGKVVRGEKQNLAGNSPAETIAETIAHELIHAATLNALKDTGPTGTRLNQQISAIQQDIKAWVAENPESYKSLDTSTQRALEIMGEDAREVPTYGLTAKRVQNALRRIPSRQSKGSVWSRFVKTVRDALNLGNTDPTVLDAILVVTEEAMEANTTPGNTNTISLSIEAPNAATDPVQFSTQEIFDALGDPNDPLSIQDAEQLQDLMDQVVTQLHGPAGAFKERARQGEAISAEDVFLKSLTTGKAPFVSATRTAGFKLNDQQAFVLEQVEATLRASMEVSGTNDLARRELSKVWQEARKNIGVEYFHDGDWATATQHEKDVAQEKRDFLFQLNSSRGNTDDHLARFAALAMVDPSLRARMDFASGVVETATDRTLTQRLIDLFKQVLSLFHHRLTKTFAGQRADSKMNTLMDQLVDIEARRRARLADDSVTWQDRVEDTIEGASKGFRKRAVDISRSNFVRRSNNGLIKAGATLVSVTAGDRGDELMNNLEEIRQKMFKERQGIMASLVSEARGAHDNALRKAHGLLRRVAKKNEQERLRINDVYRQAILESFENNGKDMTKEQKGAVTRVIMDTDMVSLMGAFTQDQLLDLMTDPAAMERAIKEYEGELKASSSTWFNYYMGAARDLGDHMATGDVRSQHQMLNAHNIASLYGTKYQSQVSPAQAEHARKVIDPLVSLYALQGMDSNQKELLVPVMRTENARGINSGILTVMEVHRKMQADALETEFKGERVHMQKGYRAQIYNQHKTVMDAPLKDRADYEAMGYELVYELAPDPHDVNQVRKGLFVILDGGPNRRLTGTISYTNESVRGSTVHGGGPSAGNTAKNQKILAQRDAYIDGLVKHGATHRPTGSDYKSYLAPVLNPRGEVVNYRYLMKQHTKDTVLDRSNAVEDVFGTMAAQAFDKVASREQNRTVIEALKAQYDAEYAQKPGAYVKISAGSSDKAMADAYRLMPDSAKRDIKEVWGGNEIWVRNDLVDLHFGYHKYSMADSIQKRAEDRKHIEKLYAWTFETIFGKKAFLRARQTGNVWAEVVKEIKDILVIKTGLTLMGNVSSNVSLLVWHGVPITDMARDHRVALEGIINYKRDYTELQKLQLMVDTNRSQNVPEANQRIEELKRDIAKNPVAFMIEEGMMPTIVEDVDMHEDPYSYKSQLGEKVEEWTGKVWKPLHTVGRYAYMTKDTPMYKALSQGTQMSDFVARYSLYQHLTTRKRNRMEHDEAIQRASDMFINYDVPSHRMIQYLNDVGLLRFTKYYIRIQRQILTLFAEYPARGIMMVVLNSLMPGLALLNDSQVSGHIGNPFNPGILEYPFVLDEIATVNAGLNLGD